MTVMANARIDTILFDLGGVLVELAGVEQMLAWSPGVTDTADLWRRWLNSPAVRRYETGGTDRHVFAEEIVTEFRLPVDAGEFLHAFTYWPRALLPRRDRLARRAQAALSTCKRVEHKRASLAALSERMGARRSFRT